MPPKNSITPAFRAALSSNFRNVLGCWFFVSLGLAFIVTPYAEYALVRVANNNVVYAAQLATANSLVTYATRFFIGGPFIGNLVDAIGRKNCFILCFAVNGFMFWCFVALPNEFTMLGGSFVQGIFVGDPVVQAYMADITTGMTLCVESDNAKVEPESVTEPTERGSTQAPGDAAESGEAGEAARERAHKALFAKVSAKYIGGLMAVFTIAFAFGAVTAGILSYQPEEDAPFGNNSTNATNALNVTEELVYDENGCLDEDKATDSDATEHLMAAFNTGFVLYIIALGYAFFKLNAVNLDTGTENKPVKKDKKDMFSTWKFLREEMLSVPFVRRLCIIVFLMQLIQNGAIGIFYYYGFFQFGEEKWTTAVYGLLLMIMVLSTAIGNTVVVSAFMKCMKSPYDVAYICGCFVILEFGGFTQARSVAVFMMFGALNIFNFIFAIMKGKIYSFYSEDKFGKVSGCIEMVNSLGNFVGPLLTTTFLTIGINATGVGDCDDGGDKFYPTAAYPWYLLLAGIVFVMALVPSTRKLDPYENEEE
jgi:MFS family permease